MSWKVFGRDPILFMNLLAAVIAGVADFALPLTDTHQSLLNAAAFGILNVVAAFKVHDGQMVAITGAFKALIALALGFGLKLTADQQVTLMALVGALGALLMRPQVVSKVPASPEVQAQVLDLSAARTVQTRSAPGFPGTP